MGKIFASVEEQMDFTDFFWTFENPFLDREKVRLVVNSERSTPALSLSCKNMLNQALKHLRRYHGMKQQELASQLGISNNYLSEIESGAKAHAITVDLLNRYAVIFKVPVSTLMLFSEQLDATKRSDRLRVSMAKKVLDMLNWIDQHDKQQA